MNMPKVRKRRSNAAITPHDLPTIEQIRNGDFVRDFVTHAETNTKVIAYKRRDSTILERWLSEPNAGVLFPVQAQRFIGDCLLLWFRCGSPRTTSNYGERIASGRYDAGFDQLAAIKELERFRSHLGPYQRHMWPCFENVVRHNEPAGIAGSQYANNPAQRIQSAKIITSTVACDLAGKLGY
jgi:hypothetical protein